MALTLHPLSTEFVQVPITGQQTSPLPEWPVWIAVISMSAQPAPTDWLPAELVAVGRELRAQILVGPDGGAVRAVGTWRVWLRVEADPEDVIRPSGKLVIAEVTE